MIVILKHIFKIHILTVILIKYLKRNISIYFPREKYELLVLGYFDAIILLSRVSFCEKLSFPFLQSYLEGIKMKIIIWKIRCLLLKNSGKRKKCETWYSISNKSTCFWSLCPSILEVIVLHHDVGFVGFRKQYYFEYYYYLYRVDI